MTKAEKAIERAIEAKKKLCKIWDVDMSHVIWCGYEKYIVIKDGKEIKIGWN